MAALASCGKLANNLPLGCWIQRVNATSFDCIAHDASDPNSTYTTFNDTVNLIWLIGLSDVATNADSVRCVVDVHRARFSLPNNSWAARVASDVSGVCDPVSHARCCGAPQCVTCNNYARCDATYAPPPPPWTGVPPGWATPASIALKPDQEVLGNNVFTVCAGARSNLAKDQCFASQRCQTDADCDGGRISTLGNQQPVPNRCVLPLSRVLGNPQVLLCDNGPAQVRLFGFGAMMLVVLFLWVLFCCEDWCYERRQRAPRTSTATRRENGGARGSPLAPTRTEYYREKSDRIVAHSTAIVEAHNRFERLQNVETLAIAADLFDVVGMYRMLALATLCLTHGEQAAAAAPRNQSMNPLDEVLLRLEKTQADVEYVLDASNPLKARQSAALELKTSLLKTIDRHPYKLGGRSLLEAVASGDYVLGSPAFRSFESRALSLLLVFEAAPTTMDARVARDPRPVRESWFPMFERFKLFYIAFWLLMVVIFVMMAKDVGVGGHTEFELLEQDSNRNPSGFGKTFFPVPPQYTFEVTEPAFATNAPGTTLIHPFTTPLVYGVMHCALAALGFVPVFVTRGLWRRVLGVLPWLKHWLPVDRFDVVHRQVGYFVLACIAAGATIWIVAMGLDCLNGFRDTCLAFDPIVDNFSDPTENVLVLRYVIFSTWFTMIPLMQFAFRPPPFSLGRITFISKYWYEICFFAHYIATVVGLVLALLGRFGIFFPVLISWGVYFIDKAVEFSFSTHAVTLVSRQSFNRTNSGYPTAVRIHFERPAKLKVTAGQWMYICVPSIDQVWHPFSICSSSGDDKLTFHIGIRTAGDPAEQWSSQSSAGGRTWTLTPETWTYRLFKRVDVTHPYLKAYVRGPYGAAFVSCFNPLNAGVMVIGAGTGLTAAESVVREILYRKVNGTPVPSRLWFVWSCRTVDDLFWCWQSMIELLLAAFDAQALDDKAVYANGATMDWLGVTIYVSRADAEQLALLRSMYPKPTPPASEPVPLSQLDDEQFMSARFSETDLVASRSGRLRGVSDAGARGADGARLRAVTSASDVNADDFYQRSRPEMDAASNIYGALKDVMRAYARAPTSGGARAPTGEQYLPMKPLSPDAAPAAPAAASPPASPRAAASLATMEFAARDEITVARRALVGHWMCNRIVEGSIDSDKTHIERHMRSMRRMLGGDTRPISICFCGPPTLAHLVEKSAKVISREGTHVDVEFSADSQ